MNGFRLFARVVWLAVVLGFSFAPSARAATIALVDEERTARPAPSVNNTAYAYPASSSGLAYIGRSATKEHFHEFLVVADDGSNQAKELGLHKFTYEDTSKGTQDTRLFHRTPSTDAQLNADHVQLEKTYDLEDCAFDPGSGNVWAVNEVGSGSTIPANTIREYNRTTGKIVREVTVPTIITTKARGNFGLESLTISGDGLTMWTCNEEALTCDGNRSSPTESTTVRLVKFTRATTADNFALAGMYAYTVPHWEHPSGGQGVNSQRGGVSGLCALPDGTLLVLERELSNDYFVIRICKADVSQATDIRDNAGLASTTGWTAAKRTQLMRYSSGGSITDLISRNFFNFEGVCLGPRCPSGRHLLALIADAGDGFSGRQTMFVPISGLSTVEMDIDAPPVGCAATYAGTFFRFEKDRSLTMRVSGLGSLGSGKTLRWHLPNCTPSSGLVAADGTATITPNADDHLTWEVVDAASAAHEHAWSAWTTTTPATCTATGTETRTCAAAGCDVPGAKETRTLAALGHAPVDDPAVAATCKAAGLTAGSHCSRCGATIVAQASVPKTAHSYANGICTVCHASSSCHAVTVAVKDWAGKTLATVDGITFDGTFSLDAKDYFTTEHDIDYVTAFDGGVVSASSDTKRFMSGSKVTWSNLASDLDTEIFVQPFAPIIPRRADGPDPYCMKDPTTTSAYWVYTYTTGSYAGLYRTSNFDYFNSVPANLNHLASGYTSNVWAPEVHCIDGKWYVYYSASTSSGSDTERSFVMAYKGSNASGLATASNWNTATRLETPDDKWAIDGTVFEANGQLYYVWSGWPGDRNVQQNIYLAPMQTPTTFVAGATRTLVSAPTEAWEKHGSPIVNEGPAVLQRNGKVTVVYSGSGSWTQYYALGYATCSDGNFTNPSSWKKHSGAVFSSRTTADAPTWAPGHCSFTQDEDGRDYIVYHAQASYDYGTGKWSWPGQWKDRGIRTQPFAWHDDEPVFGVPRPTATSEPSDYGTLDYSRSDCETRTIVRPPTTVTVTLGSPNTIDLDGGEVFEVTDYSLKQLKTAGSGTVTLKLSDTTKYVWADTIGIAPSVTIPVTVVDPSGTGGGGDEPEPPPVVVGDEWGYELTLAGGDVVRVYTNTSGTIEWTVPSGVTSVRYLVVGGGGGGGYGGGGGGYAIEDTVSVQPGSGLVVSVGAGGGGGADGANGARGRDSSLSGALEVTAEGGGYGGGVDQDGGDGGCGGGGAKNYSGGRCTQGPSGYGGTGGGSSYSGSGAGVTGRNAAAKEKMAEGGAGLVSSITGADVEYGKGGQGQTTSTPATGAAGTDGTGTGGGGSRSSAGAKGGDGVVILRYSPTGGGDEPEPTCDHEGTTVTDAAVAATCEATGLTEGSHCSNCGAVLVAQQVIAALGHDWDEGVVTTEPTETTDGVKTFACQRSGCGATKTETIPATGGDEPEPPPVVVGDDWGYELTLAGGDVVRVYTNTAGTIEWTVPGGVTSVRYLVVGGGGSGASGGVNMYGGGGGAGGLLAGDALAVSGTLRITVGAGGESVAGSRSGGSGNGNPGKASTVFAGETELLRAYGGGSGGGYVDKTRQVGGDGGSGGGGGPAGGTSASMVGGKGVEGQGVDGGASSKDDARAGNGGGLSFSSNITGTSVTYAVGGAGGELATPGAGADGADGTGNGGAGGSGASNASGKGGDGVVILRYTPAGGGDDPEPGTIKPSEGESSVTVTAETVTAAAEAALKLIEPPTGVEITPAAYAGYFKASEVKSAGAGKWIVTVAVDPEKVTPEIVATDDQPAVAVGTDGELTLNVQVKPGLYYGVKAADTLGGLKTATALNFTLATAEGTVQLTAPAPAAGAAAQFGQAVVSASPDGK